MLADVVVPGRVVRPSTQRRDDCHAIAVVEVEGRVSARLPRPRAAGLEQRRANRPRGAEPTPREPQQVAVDLPGDVDGEPCTYPAGGEPAHSQVQATSWLMGIHVAQPWAVGHAGSAVLGRRL